MIENKRINKIIFFLMLGAVLLTSVLLVNPNVFGIEINSDDNSAPDYAALFSDNDVIEINIDIEEENWEWLIENALLEEYTIADVTINGETFNNVGLRPKGNSSLDTVAKSDDTDRFSFKIKFDEYVDGQTYDGLEKIALNNMISDATYMKEYLSYQLFNMMGVPTPLYSFVNISINGEPWGLYLMVESDEEAYLDRNFGTDHGVLYKPESPGSNLKWVGEDWSNYYGIQSNAVVDITDDDFEKVVEMIKNLSSGTNIEEYINVDTTLRYFAVNTLLVNMDSYAGQSRHNYYLYEKDGIFSILPWDLNMSFGGFRIDSAQAAVDFSIDTPYSGNAEDVPLISKLLEVPEYKEKYYKYLDEAVKLYFDSGLFEKEITRLDNLIGEYVKNDATAFFSYEEYQNSLTALLKFGKLRAASVTAQLSGETVSTEVDFEISELGSMPNAGGAGGMMPGRDNAGSMQDGAMPGRDNAGGMQDGAMPGRDNADGMQDGAMPGRDNADGMQDGAMPGRDNAGGMQDGAMPGRDNAGGMQDGAMPGRDNAGGMPDGIIPGEGDGAALPDGMAPPEGDGAALPGGATPDRMGDKPIEQTSDTSKQVDPQELAKYGASIGLYIVIMIIGIAFAVKFDRKKLMKP